MNGGLIVCAGAYFYPVSQWGGTTLICAGLFIAGITALESYAAAVRK